jgi:LDH2 family malate/lactate/ureidoglycolate dehydrogenase
MRCEVSKLRLQCHEVLKAWGMGEEDAQSTSDRLAYADLHGVDSHGIALLPLYARLKSQGHLNFKAKARVLREAPGTALIDADQGLGHPAGTLAMKLSIEKARTIGIAAAAVRNSNHFGAGGAYTDLAVRAGMIGLAFSAAWDPAIVPTHGAEPRFGTNPLAVAAPAGKGEAFSFDIATSTIAIGKIRLAKLRGKPLAPGWALDENGQSETDPDRAMRTPRLTPLGGTAEMSSHKGYCLAAAVEVLATILPGAWYSATRHELHGDTKQLNVGHFFVVIDPKAFRIAGEFEADLQAMMGTLRETRPAVQGVPVVAPGDPEARAVKERTANGVDIPPMLVDQVKAIVAESGAAWVL